MVCSYTYDSLSRRTSERHRFRVSASANPVFTTNNRISVTANASTLDRSVVSEFDADSNRTALIYSSGRRLEFQRDGLDRVQRVIDQSAGALQVVANEYVGARPIQSVSANGVVSDFGYDAKRRITSLDHSRGGVRVAGFRYTWGRADNRATETQLARTSAAAQTQSYTYDSAYRLTQVAFTTGRPASEYQFDGPGNWVSRTEDGARTEFNTRQDGAPGTPGAVSGSRVADTMNEYFRLASFDAAGAFVGEDTQTHDKNGNRIQNGEHRLFFDLFDRLVRVERVSDGVTVGNYRYDAAGRRVHKEFLNPASGNQEEVFFVSDGAREIEELDGAGNVIADYVYGSLYIDQVVQMRRGGQDYHLHSNSLFSVSAVTDAAGSVVERYDYGSVYGTVTATDDAGGPKSAAAEVRNPWRFTGRRLDPETGLYHYRLRYYDPAQGRFVSRDPLGMWGDPGQRGVEQGYCGGNPVNRVDPMGDQGWGSTDQMTPEQAKAMGEHLAKVRGESGPTIPGGWGGNYPTPPCPVAPKPPIPAELLSTFHNMLKSLDQLIRTVEVSSLSAAEKASALKALRSHADGIRADLVESEMGTDDGATFTVYVETPWGTPYGPPSGDPNGIGHAWVRVNDPFTGVDVHFGFYPGDIVLENSKHNWDVRSPHYSITRGQARLIFDYLFEIGATTRRYGDHDDRSLGFGKTITLEYGLFYNNCADFTNTVARRGRVRIAGNGQSGLPSTQNAFGLPSGPWRLGSDLYYYEGGVLNDKR